MSCPIHLLDGGLGTTLEDRYKIKFSSATTPLWSSHLLISDPGTLASCQAAFVQAGADVLLTATYQISLRGFTTTRNSQYPDGVPPEEVPDFLRKAIEIGESTKSPNGQLALSLGPYGATMIPSTEYNGVYDEDHNSEEKLVRWHGERLGLFRSPENLLDRIDLVALETIPRLDEIRAVRRLGIGKKFWISVLFPGGKTMPDGTTPEEAVLAMLIPMDGAEVPWGIGVNCTKIQDLRSIVRKYEKTTSQLVLSGEVKEWPSLVLYPDGTNGGWYDAATQTWKMPDTKMKASWEHQLWSIASETRERAIWKCVIIGGCCKVNDSDIRKLRSCVSQGEAWDKYEAA